MHPANINGLDFPSFSLGGEPCPKGIRILNRNPSIDMTIPKMRLNQPPIVKIAKRSDMFFLYLIRTLENILS
jgi:hypothetical protein